MGLEFRVSGVLASFLQTGNRDQGGRYPHRVYVPKAKSASWRRGLADPYSPMRKVGAGYHVALRVTGLGEVPSTVQMRTRSRRAPGSCCFPKSPSWGVADSGLGSRRPCQTCLSHSFFCVNSWKIPPQLREQAIWSAGIWHVTAQ